MNRIFGRLLQLILLAFMLFYISSQSVDAIPKYEFTDLGRLGGSYCLAYGVNDLGQVVGSSDTDSDGHAAFIWDSENYINQLGSFDSYALDINNTEIAVGRVGDYAAIWENGIETVIGSLGGKDSPATGINNNNKVVGYSHITQDDSSPYHAWIWDSVNGITDIDQTGYSFAYDINDSDVVVGRIGSPGHNAAIWWADGTLQVIGGVRQFEGINNKNQIVGVGYLWENGNLTYLGNLEGASRSSAKAINDHTQIVGESGNSGLDDERAFLWQNGIMYDLNNLTNLPPGFVLKDAKGINNKGQIVGFGVINGERHAFLLTPITTIDSILTFFDESVANGSLEGDGNGNSANGRLNALRNMLEMVGDLIAVNDIEGACGQLKAASMKCDGELPPPDFVQGDAAESLYDMILELMAELGCE